MSDVPPAPLDRLNLDDIIARIENQQAETRTFVAEQSKFVAEAQKMQRDRWLSPWSAFAAIIGGLLGAASFVARLGHP